MQALLESRRCLPSTRFNTVVPGPARPCGDVLPATRPVAALQAASARLSAQNAQPSRAEEHLRGAVVRGEERGAAAHDGGAVGGGKRTHATVPRGVKPRLSKRLVALSSIITK